MSTFQVVLLGVIAALLLLVIVRRKPPTATEIAKEVVERQKPAPVGCSRCREIVPPWFLEPLGGELICFKCTAVYPYPKEGQTEDEYTVERQRYMEQQRSLAARGASERPPSILDDPSKDDS